MILIVEDDPQVSRLISLVLERNGYKVEIIADGAQALVKTRQMKPSMVFADLNIKGMGGDALCRKLKAGVSTSHIPFIVLSGDRDIAERAADCGADGYLAKPFEFGDLLRLVTQHAGIEPRSDERM